MKVHKAHSVWEVPAETSHKRLHQHAQGMRAECSQPPGLALPLCQKWPPALSINSRWVCSTGTDPLGAEPKLPLLHILCSVPACRSVSRSWPEFLKPLIGEGLMNLGDCCLLHSPEQQLGLLWVSRAKWAQGEALPAFCSQASCHQSLSPAF